MKELLEKFENKQPEIVFEWKDSETEAEGWVVINSLRGGAAGGHRVGLRPRGAEPLLSSVAADGGAAGGHGALHPLGG